MDDICKEDMGQKIWRANWLKKYLKIVIENIAREIWRGIKQTKSKQNKTEQRGMQ